MKHHSDLNEDEIRNELKNNICFISFEKLDGTIREGNFTLDEKFINLHYTPSDNVNKKEKRNKDGQIVAFDTDIKQWRIITFDRIKEFHVN